MKKIISALFLILFLKALSAQNADILLNHDLYHYIDRVDIKGISNQRVYNFIKPYGRESLTELMKGINDSTLFGAERGWNTRMRMLVDDSFANEESFKGILKTFFTNHRDLYRMKQKNFQLYINPVLHLSGGIDQNTYPNAVEENLPIYLNTRGLVMRGSILGKIGFHTEVADNISRVPQFLYDSYSRTQTLPGEGFVKTFKDANGLDYFTSRAYITYSPWKEVRVKFGKDRGFWGNGHQSLLLSDHAADYFFLTLNTRIWNLEYTNHFTQMIDFIKNRNDTEGTYPRKYAVFHQLSYLPSNKLTISLFESIVYSPSLPNGDRGFELQYLNPIIFYRAAEQYIGSPDNATLGLNLKYNFLRQFQLYGQVLLDDYNYSKRSEGSGYWGNKLGYQVGFKYIDAFRIPTLDLQMEYNSVRPYTYQHFNVSANYTNFGQSLGHAAGANLFDYHIIIRYHPRPAWNLYLSYSQLEKGLDEPGINYGGDIALPYINRPGDFNNTVGQGVPLSITNVYGRLSYQLWQSDIYAEVEGRYRKENDLTSTSILGGIRMNISPRNVRY